MPRDLTRLLRPRSLAVIGGGAWAAGVVGAARRIGFDGPIRPVHPGGKEIAGLASVRSIGDLDRPPDAVFVGVNRDATLEVTAELNRIGAGGAVAFASGFSEAAAEDAAGRGLQEQLVDAAGDMPVLGPNCYGFVNALDRVAVWPDQHGMVPVDRGVAILTQSSNIAINLSMQRRGLPIGYMVTCGNMAQTSQAEIALALLEDERVTALGLHIEGFGDLRQWQTLAHAAHRRGVPMVAIKVGASAQARAATVSHTASLAGSAAGASALLDRLGIAQVGSLPTFLETLKLMHCEGGLASRSIASISCSGGEASLVADMAQRHGLDMPPLQSVQKDTLRDVLGPHVALANPLDYHTYIWRETGAMARAWQAMTGHGLAMTLSVVDYPHTDAADWDCATRAAISARNASGAPFGVVASLPELMPADIADRLMGAGVVPFCGLDETLGAIRATAARNPPGTAPILLPGPDRPAQFINEAEAKQELRAAGVPVPQGAVATSAKQAARAASGFTGRVVLKGLGLAHKSDSGAVRIGLTPPEIEKAAQDMAAERFLVENCIEGGIAELLVGVLRDPAHGFVLTLGAGGVLTELWQDTASILLPADRDVLLGALRSLRIWPLLEGYRGRPGADTGALVMVLEAICAYVTENSETLEELEINPLICTPTGAVAADALLRKV